MTARPIPPIDDLELTRPTPAEERDVLHCWRLAEQSLPPRHAGGMDGPRGPLPEQPDDIVASLLLAAAGHAHERGEARKAVAILKLIARDYRHSAEAAYARTALDRLEGR